MALARLSTKSVPRSAIAAAVILLAIVSSMAFSMTLGIRETSPVQAAGVASNVTVNPTTAGQIAEVVFDFSVDEDIPANIGEFVVTFDKDSIVPSSISRNAILISASKLTNESGGISGSVTVLVPLAFDPTFDVDPDDARRVKMTMKVPDMNQSTSHPGVGVQGIAAGADVRVVLTTSAGFRNSEEADNQGFDIRMAASASGKNEIELKADGTAEGDNRTRVFAEAEIKIFTSSPTRRRGESITVIGRGYKSGLTATIWLDNGVDLDGDGIFPEVVGLSNVNETISGIDINGDGDAFDHVGGPFDEALLGFDLNKDGSVESTSGVVTRTLLFETDFRNNASRDFGERDLGGTIVAGDGTFTATFTVNNPPFSSAKLDEGGLTDLNNDGDTSDSGIPVNVFNAIDGESQVANVLNTRTLELRTTLTAQPGAVGIGESLTLTLRDFPPFDTVASVNLGGVPVAVPSPAPRVDANGDAVFEVTVPLGVPFGIQTLFVFTSTDDADTTVNVLRATLTSSHTHVVANQDLVLNGSGFGVGSNVCIDQGKITLSNVPLLIDADSLHSDCGSTGIKVDNGAFEATVIVRNSGSFPFPSALLTPAIHALKVIDDTGIEGSLALTIKPRVLIATPQGANPGDELTLFGQGYPASNPDTSPVGVSIRYDCGGPCTDSTSALPNSRGEFQASLHVPPQAPAPSTNTITSVIAGTTTVDTITHEVGAEIAELVVLKSDSPDPVDVGATLTYDIEVQNRGTAPAHDVALMDTLPTGLTVDSASISQGMCDTFDVPGVLATLNVGNNPEPVILDSAHEKLYVANTGSNNVSVIDTTTNSVVDTITVGTEPDRMRLNPLTNRLYVENVGSNNISIIDTLTNNLVTTVTVGSEPGDFRINQTTNRVFVVNRDDGTVSIFDGATTTDTLITTVTVGGTGRNVRIDEATNRAYVTSLGTNTLSIIDGNTTTDSLLAQVSVGDAPRRMVVIPALDRVAVVNRDDGTVSIVDGGTTSDSVITTVGVGVRPDSIALHPTTNLLYVGNENSNDVTVIDGATNIDTTVTTINVGEGPDDIQIDTATNRAYVSNFDGNSVSIIDTSSNLLLNTVLVGQGPIETHIDSTANLIYTLDELGNTISVIDGASNQVIDILPVGILPADADIDPNTGQLYVSNWINGTVSVIGRLNRFKVFCELGTIEPDTIVEIIISSTTSADLADTVISNMVEVTSSTLPGQTLVATQDTLVQTPAPVDLAITKADSPDPVEVGETLTYDINVSNLGTATAHDVVLVDHLPSGVDFTSVSASQGMCYPFEVPGVLATLGVGEEPEDLRFDAVNNQLYVSNLANNSVTVIDTNSNSVVDTITVGSEPSRLRLNPSINRLYVGNEGSNDITIIDTVTNIVVTTVPVGIGPGDFRVNQTTNRVFVTNRGEDTVSIFDGATAVVPAVTTITVGGTPRNVRLDEATNRAYVTSMGTNTLSIIDGNTITDSLLAQVDVGDSPRRLSVIPALDRVAVVNRNSGTVSIIDGGTTINSVEATVTVGSRPDAVVLDPTNNFLYVTNEDSNSVSVVDGATNVDATVATINVGAAPDAVAINPLTGRVYVGNLDDSTLSVIDTTSHSVIATLPVGESQDDALIDEVANRVYVVGEDDGTVTLIDGATNLVVEVFSIGSVGGSSDLDPSTGEVYVSSFDDETVSIIGGIAALKIICELGSIDPGSRANVSIAGTPTEEVADTVVTNIAEVTTSSLPDEAQVATEETQIIRAIIPASIRIRKVFEPGRDLVVGFALNDVKPGSHSITEDELMEDYVLTDISCDDEDSSGDVQSRTATVQVAVGETVTCTFTNTRESGPQPANLVGHWKLDDGQGQTAKDSSGNDNHGTLLPNTPVWTTAGQIDGALDFQSNGDAVRIPSSSVLNGMDSLTISLWFYADSEGEDDKGRFIMKEDSFSLEFGNYDSKIIFDADRWRGRGGKWRWETKAGESLLGGWHHVAVTYDYSSMNNHPEVYLDGERLTDRDRLRRPAGNLTQDNTSIYFGNREDWERTFDGRLDDVQIYSRVLSAEEIEALARN